MNLTLQLFFNSNVICYLPNIVIYNVFGTNRFQEVFWVLQKNVFSGIYFKIYDVNSVLCNLLVCDLLKFPCKQICMCPENLWIQTK